VLPENRLSTVNNTETFQRLAERAADMLSAAVTEDLPEVCSVSLDGRDLVAGKMTDNVISFQMRDVADIAAWAKAFGGVAQMTPNRQFVSVEAIIRLADGFVAKAWKHMPHGSAFALAQRHGVSAEDFDAGFEIDPAWLTDAPATTPAVAA
jgi:hypothetical protein